MQRQRRRWGLWAAVAGTVLALGPMGSMGPMGLAQTRPAAPPPCAAAGQPQASSQPCTPIHGSPPVPAPPSAAQQFPYPGSDAAPTVEATPNGTTFPAQPPAGAAATPAAPFGRTPLSPGNAFPYPGDPEAAGASSSSSSSSNSSSSSSSSSSSNSDSAPDLDDVGSEGTNTRRKLPKVTKLQNDEDRAYEDLTVAKFYQDKGDLQAAYLRSKDAVKAQPQLSEAHLALAQVAEKMQKRDEAVAEFTTYLKLEPQGESSKTARNALARLK